MISRMRDREAAMIAGGFAQITALEGDLHKNSCACTKIPPTLSNQSRGGVLICGVDATQVSDPDHSGDAHDKQGALSPDKG
jgi:hypothetical protein